MDKNIFSCFYLLMFFQPVQFDIFFLCFYLLIFFLSSQSESVWKTVPSEARVTRDEVSGFQTRIS